MQSVLEYFKDSNDIFGRKGNEMSALIKSFPGKINHIHLRLEEIDLLKKHNTFNSVAT